MATDDAREETPPAIVALAVQVDELRTRVQRMHAELRAGPSGPSGSGGSGGPASGAEHRAAVKAMGAATLDLLDAQSRLRAMRVAHRQQRVAELLEQDRRREQLRLWQLTGGVALAGVLIVVLAASGAIPAARLAIGVPVLLAGALMAISMLPVLVRDAGQHAIDLRKAIIAAALAFLSLLGALTWRPLGYACLLALAVAAVPVVSALRARRRRDAAAPGGRDTAPPEGGGGRG
jgi:hypothetical protein